MALFLQKRGEKAYKIQMERLDWILSQENKYLIGFKVERNKPSYYSISEEARILLLEEIRKLRELEITERRPLVIGRTIKLKVL